MKLVQLLFIIFFVFTASANFAQREKTSPGPAPYTGTKSNDTIVNIPDNPAVKAYGHEHWSKSTLSMPVPAGTPFNTLNVFLAPNASFPSSMTKGGDGNYYLITHEPALYKFNNITGVVTLLGYITGLSGNIPTGISYNPANSRYYIITPENLFSFDVSTRAASLIGNTGVPSSVFISLCFNEGGACYAYDIETDAAYIINPATGRATLLGPLGYIANYGQGMSYDMETGTIYLSAFNYALNSGQLRTMDPGTGATTLIRSWGNQQIAPFALDTQFPAPSNITQPGNPNPSDLTVNIPISGSALSWNNGAGTTSNEIWFGSAGHVSKVYDGPAITSYSLPVLTYQTKYLWWVVCKNSNGKTQGLPWTFTTIQNPNYFLAFQEPFNNGSCWTPIGPQGLVNWGIAATNNAGGSPPSELDLFYDPIFGGLSRVMSCSINSSNLYQNTVTFRHYYDLYMSGGPSIGLAVTYDSGATITVLWETRPIEDIVGRQVTVSFTPVSGSYRLIFFLSGSSYFLNQWDIDDVIVDYVLPVELSSFTAAAIEGGTELNWSTSTETNNKGFEIQRSVGSEFNTIGFIEGNGTTTKAQNYTYIDNNLSSGKYSYRLKQIDFDGAFQYSTIVEAEVLMISQYTLNQNYPNPFNPGTSISFNLAVDSKVSLKVFDILGQEIASLIDGNLAAGGHKVDFNAESLNSGVYVYRIDASGVNGRNFTDMKKMLLLK